MSLSFVFDASYAPVAPIWAPDRAMDLQVSKKKDEDS